MKEIMLRRFAACLSGLFLLAACGPTRTAAPSAAPAAGTPPWESTAVPSPVPVQPTRTPTPLPALRFFTEEFDGDLAYWAFLQVDNGQPDAGPSPEGGQLVFDLSAPNQWVYALYGGQDYADVRIDARVEVRVGQDGAPGVVCRYTEKDGWYEFNIYPDQAYTLLFGQWLMPGVARFTPIYRGSSGKIESAANEIGLICQGDTLTPYVNGTQLRKAQVGRYGLRDGKVGLSAASFEEAPFMVADDWVKVSEP
jgi:hypothetical protein